MNFSTPVRLGTQPCLKPALLIFNIFFFPLSRINRKKNCFAAYRLPIFLQNPLLAKGAGNTAFWPILSGFVMTSIQTHTLKKKNFYTVSNAIQPVPLTNFHLHRQTPNQEIPFIPEANCSERSYISIQKDINRRRHIRRKKRSRSQSNQGNPLSFLRAVGKGGKKVWIGF